MDTYTKITFGAQNHKSNTGTYDDLNQPIKYPVYHKDYNMDDNQAKTEETSSSHTTSATYSSGSSKYLDYPASRPFINTEYTRVDVPIHAYPTSDRDAVISALRNLQEKIKKLELERTGAEQNLKSLTSETEQYKKILKSGKHDGKLWSHQGGQKGKSGSGDVAFTQAWELEGQLSSAERRIQLLEKQLDHMRKLVAKSERNHQGLKEQVGRDQVVDGLSGIDIKEHVDRLNELERDQSRLTATQTIAESKIRELERKVREEKIHRQTVEDKAAQLEMAVQDQKTLPDHGTQSSEFQTTVRPHPTQVQKTKKPPKKKKKTPLPKRPTSACRSAPVRHYRLNLAEIPFVAGKSTGPSHSLGANVQKVLAMMKTHNPTLCSQAFANGECQRSDSPSSSTDSSTDTDLSELLMQLKDEFGQLSSKHQEIVEQVHMARDIRMKEKLEQEMDLLAENMENKSRQILKIKQHQKKMKDAKRGRSSSAKRSEKSKEPFSATAKPYHYHHANNDIISDRNIKSKSHRCNKPIGNSALGKPALFMLRDMKKLQSTLRRDDICWE